VFITKNLDFYGRQEANKNLDFYNKLAGIKNLDFCREPFSMNQA
jgi:hypothetical protein